MNIAIVVISYNSEKFLKNNLISLTGQTLPFREILVIDNLSEDQSREIVQDFPDVTLIAAQENLGYSRAANLGITRSRSDIVIIANPDIILTPNFNSQVAKIFNKNPQVGILSPLLLRFDKQTIDSAGQDASLSRYPREHGFNRALSSFTLRERDIFSVCGAVTVFRRRILEQLKLDGEYYDEDYFLFWEDFDLGWRADLYQIKKKFIPGLIAYHFRSGSLKESFLKKISLSMARPGLIKFHLIKNRYLTLIKNFRFKRDWYTLPFIFIKDFIWVLTLTLLSPKIIIHLIGSKKPLIRAFKKRKLIKKNE